MASSKKITLQDRLKFTLNYIKNFMFIITPLTAFIVYVSVLIIKDTDYYKKVDAVIEWYETKSQSFAVGLRVNKEKDDNGLVIYKIIYKATDGETYKAFYNADVGAYYYSDSNGKLRECH